MAGRGGPLVCRLTRSEEHTSELQSPCNLVCRLLLAKKRAIVLDADAPACEPRLNRASHDTSSPPRAQPAPPAAVRMDRGAARSRPQLPFFFKDRGTADAFPLPLLRAPRT